MTSKIEKYRWMRWLPDAIKREDHTVKYRGRGDDGYLLSIRPMATVIGEQPWLFVSNGAASLLVRDHMDWGAPSETQVEIIRGLVQKEIRGRVFPLAQFQRWLGRGWKSALPCESCNADWAKNCPSCFGIGRSSKRCHDCNDTHECACPKCIGEGVLYCPACVGENGFERKPGHYRGVVFDRALLARFLAQVDFNPTAQVRIMAEGAGPVWVEAHDRSWRVAIMPLREPESSRVPEWAHP